MFSYTDIPFIVPQKSMMTDEEMFDGEIMAKQRDNISSKASIKSAEWSFFWHQWLKASVSPIINIHSIRIFMLVVYCLFHFSSVNTSTHQLNGGYGNGNSQFVCRK